jgi:hypothetical protein
VASGHWRRELVDRRQSGPCLIVMNAQEAQTLQLHEIVVWTPDGMKGEVIVMDGSGVEIRWDDGQCGYYQFTDLLSQIERLT